MCGRDADRVREKMGSRVEKPTSQSIVNNHYRVTTDMAFTSSIFAKSAVALALVTLPDPQEEVMGYLSIFGPYKEMELLCGKFISGTSGDLTAREVHKSNMAEPWHFVSTREHSEMCDRDADHVRGKMRSRVQ
nr:hypothetical transcript [Hymenolepis microstoma]